MDSNIKISVIIPAYNAQDTIISCLESVISQTYSVFEIIIVNDGSTDYTENVIAGFINSNNLKNIRLISQYNGGPSAARNNGIVNSSGNWIAFIDSDDNWLPNKIESQVCVLNIIPDVSLIGTLLFPNLKNIKTPFELVYFNSLLYRNKVFTSTVLVKREVFECISFDIKQKHSEDYKLWLKISLKYKIIVLNDGLTIYAVDANVHKVNSLSSKLWQMEKGELKNYFYFYKENEINLFKLLSIVSWSLLKFFFRVFFK